MPDKKRVMKVKSNGFEFTIDPATLESADFLKKSPTLFHLINEHKSVSARLLETDPTHKHIALEIDGERFEVEIKDELDQVLDQLGLSAVSNRHIKEIKAPMPGMVLSVSVTEGQAVVEGDRLLILGAMKMENSILISAPATIKKIRVEAGQAVDKGQVMIDLE